MCEKGLFPSFFFLLPFYFVGLLFGPLISSPTVVETVTTAAAEAVVVVVVVAAVRSRPLVASRSQTLAHERDEDNYLL